MRAHEFTEVFDTPADSVVWKTVNSNLTVADWTDKTGSRVQTSFNTYAPGVVDVSFRRTDSTGNASITRTNTAGETSSSVFGGVTANVKDFLSKNPQVTYITFGASDDPARSRLYSRMAQRAGVLGLELVNPTDQANLPPAVKQQQKTRNGLVYRTMNSIPTITKTATGMPTLTTDSPYTKKYDQFVLKRQGVQTAPRPGMAPNRAGDEYTNMYGGRRPTAFQDQQYLKDLTAKLQQWPNDANLSAELSALSRRVPQP